MNFQVPQFIEIEDKIFGPFTWKQFLYLAGGAGVAYLCYAYLPFLVAIIPIGVVLGLAAGLAFFKVNNRPFILTLESAIKYFMGAKLYIWKQTPRSVTPGNQPKITPEAVTAARLTEGRLRDLAWSLDINNKLG